MRRVIAYIDGHNLYHGLRAKYGRRYHWLDVQALAQSLLPPNHVLERVRYFTARVRNQPASVRRQATYLSALASHCAGVHIVEGRFQERVERCRVCGAAWTTYEEKETDVNIAAAILADVTRDEYDTAILISADGDLAPAVDGARWLSPVKRFYVALPPRRKSDALARVADATFTIGDSKIRNSQLPTKVLRPDGLVLERPAYWR